MRKTSRSPSRERDERRNRGNDAEAEGERNGSARTKKADDKQPSLFERTKMLPAGKAGGAYIPPFRLKQMQAEMADKSSAEYQRMSWEALKKSINGLVNKVTKPNISGIAFFTFLPLLAFPHFGSSR
jgi:pre-mRNA-splicing factor CWC22